MANKNSFKNLPPAEPVWVRAGLSLSLVPMIAGLIFIVAWAFDFELIKPLSNQISVGFLFFLISFAMSNLFQRRWNLFIGWTLLMLADLTTLIIVNSLPAQIFGLVLALAGLVFLGTEYFKRIRAGSNQPR
jgi:hypothetical protein